MAQIKAAIRIDDGHVTFAFVDPIRFATLVVTTESGQELWELHPCGMESVDLISGCFLVKPVLSQDEARAVELVERIASSADDNFASVDRIVYGQPPDGYEEVTPAKPLTPGEHYQVVVLRAPEYVVLDFVA